ncbi:MAG TPA: 16S rRNA (adenine(1518)-N(6)/adenine(1519)-N(6))-dimethyltransferase RsmA [Clostridiales bacterium]|jgi:16S rRNA (adenine1518-N6/adenine1519-N6)-dimethyltransferase|nr:16S rRNA (adenine(1518)-N(6)/adenine(1519)-N(6))-dimethyltransferase RsmA [Clostridiales bacterium]
MNFFSIKEVRELLDRHGFSFRKSLGQNFITKQWIPEQIVSASGINRDHGVLEIGPGIGTLTKSLCDSAGKVTCLEVDDRLLPVLNETLAGADNLIIRQGDVLKADLSEIVRDDLKGLTPVACANLPYYITTPVLERLFESRLFKQITVMVQKEVARRICASAGSPDYGAFTVFSQFYSRPEILFDVPASCFLPQPKVDSSVVIFHMHSDNPYGIEDEDLFFRIVRSSFAQRRKTLINGLISALPMKKDELLSIILSCGFRPDVRGETLSIESFAKITAKIAENLVNYEH